MPQRPCLFFIRFAVFGWIFLFSFAARAQDKTYQPPIAPASDEGQQAIATFKIPKGFKVTLFAAEPMLANPVALCIDEQGRLYIAETFRQGDAGGVVDNRGHMYWLDDDLAAQTVEDRRKFFLKHRKDKEKLWTTHHDRIRLLEDTNGDHKADKATVFSDGYNDLMDGTGAGLLAWKGNVYYTCIPKLYKLRDTNNDGKADKKEVLSDGYGVKVAFRGHDLHGLTMGPDGRIYFSIGDRGYHIKTKEGKTLKGVNEGAVFRSELDGSNLEVVHTGLRNPQELVFDVYGNLFAGDNNSDGGDKARWVYIVEGGDSGWQMNFQYLSDRGPWNREGYWHLYDKDKTPAFLVPPIAHIGNGPSGVSYYPGAGLSDDYKGKFFMVDFKGGAARSGIHMFNLKPRGAWFEVQNLEPFVWNSLITDMEFGYDGAIYFTDWVHGWEGLGKGRVFRMTDPKNTIGAAETAALFKDGFDRQRLETLTKLLGHQDRRVRLAAQLELVKRDGRSELINMFNQTDDRMARLHALWGIKQVVSKMKENERLALARSWADTIQKKKEKDPEIRAQLAKAVGDFAIRSDPAQSMCAQLLKDDNGRVQFFAAISLGKTSPPNQHLLAAVQLAEFLMKVGDTDPYLRHAAVMGLHHLGNNDLLLKEIINADPFHKSIHVRMGILLALRRSNDPRIAQFLDDDQPRIVIEAARAIHDRFIEDAMPTLAGRLADKHAIKDEAFVRRAIAANHWLGRKDRAKRVANFATRADVSDAMRIEAIDALHDWAGESSRGRVMGDWRPVVKRDANEAAPAAQMLAGALLKGDATVSIRERAARLALRYPHPDNTALLYTIATNAKEAGSVRRAALHAIGKWKHPKLTEAVTAALSADDAAVRTEAQNWLGTLKPEAAVAALTGVLEKGTVGEQQNALAVLAKMKSEPADNVILAWMDKMIAGKAPLGLHLDLLEAARDRNTPRLKLKLAAFEAAMKKEDPLANKRHMLEGGNYARGELVFWRNQLAQCRRCHRVGDRGEGEAGPNVGDVGLRFKRDYLLASIIAPNRDIAKGFDTFDIETKDGERIVGVLRAEDNDTVTIVTPMNTKITIKKKDIHSRRKALSAMPQDIEKHLSAREIRDLVEYLAQQKAKVAEN